MQTTPYLGPNPGGQSEPEPNRSHQEQAGRGQRMGLADQPARARSWRCPPSDMQPPPERRDTGPGFLNADPFDPNSVVNPLRPQPLRQSVPVRSRLQSVWAGREHLCAARRMGRADGQWNPLRPLTGAPAIEPGKTLRTPAPNSAAQISPCRRCCRFVVVIGHENPDDWHPVSPLKNQHVDVFDALGLRMPAAPAVSAAARFSGRRCGVRLPGLVARVRPEAHRCFRIRRRSRRKRDQFAQHERLLAISSSRYGDGISPSSSIRNWPHRPGQDKSARNESRN